MNKDGLWPLTWAAFWVMLGVSCVAEHTHNQKVEVACIERGLDKLCRKVKEP